MAAPDASQHENPTGAGAGTADAASPTPAAPPMRIVITENGPYEVEGSVPLLRVFIEANGNGHSWEWGESEPLTTRRRYRLCRCGGSHTKPFCDSTHLTNGFDGTETASRAPYLEGVEVFEGPELTLTDNMPLCANARFCDAFGSIWRLVEQRGDRAADLVVREAAHCPSGRLIAWRAIQDGRLAPAGEPEFAPSIGVVEDPAGGCSGGLWVRGGIEIVAADGTVYEVRNRVTLCRCGHSQNKPFCDGTHSSIRFNDGHVDDQPEAEEQSAAG